MFKALAGEDVYENGESHVDGCVRQEDLFAAHTLKGDDFFDAIYRYLKF